MACFSNHTLSRRFGRRIKLAMAGAMTLGLAGCGGVDGVELNGKLFELAGISGDLMGSPKENQVPDRAPLVMPPTPRLPEPGTADVVHNASVPADWPADADMVVAARDAARKREVKAMCADRDWMERTKPKEFNRVTEDGRLCASQAASMLRGIFGGETEETSEEPRP